MPVQPGAVACPRCTEDRPTLITEINDPMGKRYYCCVCGYEFRLVPAPSQQPADHAQQRNHQDLHDAGKRIPVHR